MDIIPFNFYAPQALVDRLKVHYERFESAGVIHALKMRKDGDNFKVVAGDKVNNFV